MIPIAFTIRCLGMTYQDECCRRAELPHLLNLTHGLCLGNKPISHSGFGHEMALCARARLHLLT